MVPRAKIDGQSTKILIYLTKNIRRIAKKKTYVNHCSEKNNPSPNLSQFSDQEHSIEGEAGSPKAKTAEPQFKLSMTNN